jgi:hypothetical protein
VKRLTWTANIGLCMAMSRFDYLDVLCPPLIIVWHCRQSLRFCKEEPEVKQKRTISGFAEARSASAAGRTAARHTIYSVALAPASTWRHAASHWLSPPSHICQPLDLRTLESQGSEFAASLHFRPAGLTARQRILEVECGGCWPLVPTRPYLCPNAERGTVRGRVSSGTGRAFLPGVQSGILVYIARSVINVTCLCRQYGMVLVCSVLYVSETDSAKVSQLRS